MEKLNVVYTTAILVLVLFSGLSVMGAMYISPAGYIRYNIFLYNTTSAATIHPIAITCNPTNGYLYVLTTDSVYIVDPLNNSVVGRIPLNISMSNPTDIVYDPKNGYIYVAVNNSEIIVIDPTTEHAMASIPVHGEVLQMVYVGGYIYAAVSSSNSVVVIDPANSSVVTSIKVGSTPIGLAADTKGRYVYVADFGSGEVSVISTANNSVVANISVGGFPWGITYDPQNGYVYVSEYNGWMAVIDPLTERVIANISIPYGSPRWAVYDPSNGYVYVVVLNTVGNSIAAVGPNNTVVGDIQLGFLPGGITYDPITGYLYVTGINTGTVSVIVTPHMSNISTTTTGQTSATNSATASNIQPSETSNQVSPSPSPIDMAIAVVGGLIIAILAAILLRAQK